MRSGREPRRAKGRLAGVETSALVLALGGCALAIGWIAGSGMDASTAPASQTRVVAHPPARLPAPGFVADLVEVPAEPEPLVQPEPPRRAAPPSTPGCGALDVALTSGRGDVVPLGLADRLHLTAIDPPQGGAREWQVSPDRDGHIRVADLPPGRYEATLSTDIDGDFTCAELAVRADGPTPLRFCYYGPPLAQRIAVRFVGPSERPHLADVLLHAGNGRILHGHGRGADLIVFDGLPRGKYDLEVRRLRATQPCWQSDLRPGTLRGIRVNLSACEPGPEPAVAQGR